MVIGNFIHNVQINILIKKEENTHLKNDGYEYIKNKLNSLGYDLFSKVNQECLMEESHQFTLNIIGKFDPFHNDKEKQTDYLLKYDTDEEFTKGTIQEVINYIFKKEEIHARFGKMSFQDL